MRNIAGGCLPAVRLFRLAGEESVPGSLRNITDWMLPHFVSCCAGAPIAIGRIRLQDQSVVTGNRAKTEAALKPQHCASMT